MWRAARLQPALEASVRSQAKLRAEGDPTRSGVTAADRTRLLTSIAARCLHLWEAGTGSPTLVLVPAVATPAMDWLRVARELAGHTRVCTYDRPGVGWSEPAPWWESRSAGPMADELHDLL
jgi:pimeloyl-ACP methyl ester carboxylesterase